MAKSNDDEVDSSNMEPFRIKMVEPIFITNKKQRAINLERAGYNPFNIQSRHVTIDMLTDSGTNAMSSNQWAALMKGDESYAGSSSYFNFKETAENILGFKHVLPVHQGRGAERILFSSIVKPGDVLPNNTHFDTTRTNVLKAGGEPVDLPQTSPLPSDTSFRGNMDVELLREALNDPKKSIPLVMSTITNNGGGGSPVSMRNLREVSELCNQHKVFFFIDACRFAENAYFIKTREEGYSDSTIKDIVREMFSLADGCYMSVKKDGLVNIGAILATNNDALNDQFREELIATEGFISYGGLAGRDLDAIAVGLHEGLDEKYLGWRIWSTSKLGTILKANGVPIIEPIGGHAVYIDAATLCDHIPISQFPAWALNCAIYLEGGIRGCEIGGVMLSDQSNALNPVREMVRLAIPRRVYTVSHFEYIGKVLKRIVERKEEISGFRLESGSGPMRHFIAKMSPIKSRRSLT